MAQTIFLRKQTYIFEIDVIIIIMVIFGLRRTNKNVDGM